MDIINIGKNRELFWDNYLIDTDKTTAFHRIGNVAKKDCCFVFDREQWLENASISYPQLLKVENVYRLYYSPWTHGKANPFITVAVIESEDGINWDRPNLNIFSHPELKENNIVLEGISDSAFIFIDTNPSCPAEEKFKAIGKASAPYGNRDEVYGLWCWTSPDGYHFTLSHPLTEKGRFDSLNTIFWKDGKYHCYLRDFHNIIPGAPISKATRDIRVMYSEDMINWTEPRMLDFNDGEDIALYTNNVIPYDRAPHMLMGFPVRYCERPAMTDNIRQIKSYNTKMIATSLQENQFDIDRTALVATDTIFMCSRDGKHWHRYNEAFLSPDYENENNWVYGDCYLAYNMVDPGNEKYYLYEIDGHFDFENPKKLCRYEIIKDRFACIMAADEEKTIVTKPLVFDGSKLSLNFSTSAFGYIIANLLDEAGNSLPGTESFEVFGNSIDRKVAFENGKDFSAFSGNPVRLRFRMRDAKLYSMKFE